MVLAAPLLLGVRPLALALAFVLGVIPAPVIAMGLFLVLARSLPVALEPFAVGLDLPAIAAHLPPARVQPILRRPDPRRVARPARVFQRLLVSSQPILVPLQFGLVHLELLAVGLGPRTVALCPLLLQPLAVRLELPAVAANFLVARAHLVLGRLNFHRVP